MGRVNQRAISRNLHDDISPLGRFQKSLANIFDGTAMYSTPNTMTEVLNGLIRRTAGGSHYNIVSPAATDPLYQPRQHRFSGERKKHLSRQACSR
jgi:hypothetical protein